MTPAFLLWHVYKVLMLKISDGGACKVFSLASLQNGQREQQHSVSRRVEAAEFWLFCNTRQTTRLLQLYYLAASFPASERSPSVAGAAHMCHYWQQYPAINLSSSSSSWVRQQRLESSLCCGKKKRGLW